MQQPATQPLWQQLTLCWQTLQQVSRGVSLTAALKKISPAKRGAAQALAYAALRNWGKAAFLAQQLGPRKNKAAVKVGLQLGLALLSQPSFMQGYNEFTVVNQLVEAAKRNYQAKFAVGFLNACWRRYLRQQTAWEELAEREDTARWNHPLWWITKLQRDYPQSWQEILRRDLVKPPLFLRVNERQIATAEYEQELQLAGIGAQVVAAPTIRLDEAVAVEKLPLFATGGISVQDIGAQLAAPLLAGQLPKAESGPLRLLDACAAPGGKACHLLELVPEARLDAVEFSAQRAQLIEANLARLGLAARIIVADAAQPTGWWDGQLYDGVLLDAPCSGSGVVRKHPDGLWLKKETDIAELVVLQQKILTNLWQVLKPGAPLLYCTCSIFKCEGQEQIERFLQTHADAVLLPCVGQLLPVVGQDYAEFDTRLTEKKTITDGDGFYYALLVKKRT